MGCHRNPRPYLREPENVTKMGYSRTRADGPDSREAEIDVANAVHAHQRRSPAAARTNCSTLPPLRRARARRHVMTHDHDHEHDARARHHDDRHRRAGSAADAESRLLEVAARARGQGDVPGRDRSGKEFPPSADQRANDPLSRRNFFQLMGASMALAGVGACHRYEKEEIVPLARRPEDQTPGITQQYATAFELGGVGHALLATSFEGRPINLDGNPEHPVRERRRSSRAPQRHAGAARRRRSSQARDPPPLRSGSLAEPDRQGHGDVVSRRSHRARRGDEEPGRDAHPQRGDVVADAARSAHAARLRACSGTSTSRCRGTTSAPASGWRSATPVRPIAKLDRARRS